MELTLLGVRGSIPVCDPAMGRVGGHTACVAIAHDGADPTLILDAGSGLTRYARQFGGRPFRGTIVLGHLHWDHVIGLPFFPGADHDEAATHVLVPAQDGLDAVTLLAGLMSPPSFPITPDELGESWRFGCYDSGPMTCAGFDILARDIPHKGGRTMGLRVSDAGGSVAYLSDHAPQDLGPGPDGYGVLHDTALELADGVDVLIHDAQYRPAELTTRGHYGHAAADYAVRLGEAAGVGRVLLYHHDPNRTDDEVDDVLAAAGRGATVAVDVAREGSTLFIGPANAV